MGTVSMEEYFGDWYPIINTTILNAILERLLKESNYCPTPDKVFQAFVECKFKDLKVVFIGMDPYPQRGVATGLAFANAKETKPSNYSPSLKVLIDAVNKYYDDLPLGGFDCTLKLWCKQGVLLLNSALTVKENEIGSHMLLWRPFIISLIQNTAKVKPYAIFVFFGTQAKSLHKYISNSPAVKVVHPAFCVRNKSFLPNFFKEIDDIMITKGSNNLIYWL